MREHRNLKTAQRMFGHKDITTLRYTRSDVEDVRAVMEAVEKHNPDTQSAGQEGKNKGNQQLGFARAPAPKAGALQAEPRPAVAVF